MAAGVMSEGILIIASVVIATSIAAVVMNQVGVFQSTFTATTESQKDTLLTKVKIILATNTTDSHVAVWVKNVGVHPISSLGSMDVYFGEIDKIQRIQYDQGTDIIDDRWRFSPAVPTPVWQIMDTFAINITDSTIKKDVTYHVTISTPNGVTDEHFFSLPG